MIFPTLDWHLTSRIQALCEATEDWIREMSVSDLLRGRKQPFYNVLALDGTQRCMSKVFS